MEGLPGLLLAALVGMGAVRQRRRPAIATRHIILADPGAPLEECADHVERCGARLLRVLPFIHGVVCECPGPATVSAISGHATVTGVEPDWRVPLPRQGFLAQGPRCSGLGELVGGRGETVPWGVSRVGAPPAWTRTRGEGVRVAVMDTGVDTEHPDLAPVLRGGINLLEPDAPPEDDNGHGTHVAGVIAAADSDQGVVGVAPACELYAVKAFDRSGSAATSDVLTALQWCADYGIQVVNTTCSKNSICA